MLGRMTQWYAKELGDGMMAYLPLADIEAEFEPRFKAAGQPDNLAVFKRHVLGSSLYCDVTAYFPPAAAAIAQACGATPCPAPDADDLTLVLGNEGCWARIFESQSK